MKPRPIHAIPFFLLALFVMSGCASTKLMKNCKYVGEIVSGDRVSECEWY